MADDLSKFGDPREVAGRRLLMGEEDRASRARIAKMVEDAIEANRSFARNQTATRIPPIPEGATRIQPVPEGAVGANDMRNNRAPPPNLNDAAKGVVNGLVRRAAGKVAGVAGLLIPSGPGVNTEAPPGGMPPTAAQIRRRAAMADQIGREAGREYMERSAARAPQEDVAAFRNQRAAQTDRSKSSDMARITDSEELPLPPKPPRNPPRQATRRPAAPVESEADKLNAMEIDRIMRERAAENTGTMKKGGKVQAYKKGGGTDCTMKMAKGGAVRGCGIAQRGKTRGVMR